MRFQALICAALALALASVDAPADPCPESCVFSYCSTRARRDTTFFDFYVSGASGSASYDLVAGGLYISFDSGNDGVADASATGRDRFTLVGPNSPSPVSFTVSLRLVGQTQSRNNGYSSVWGHLGEGNNTPVGAGVSSYYGNSIASLDETVSLQLVHLVGEPFELTYQAGGYGKGVASQGSLWLALSFPNLPPGYGVASCQGYSIGVVVPTLSRSWGQVKSRYR